MTRNRCAPMLLAVAIALPSPATGGQRSMTFEDVLGYKAVSSPSMSPDGEVVAFVVREADLEKNTFVEHIWRYDAASGRSRPITSQGRRNRLPQWSPDGTRLAFLSDREERTQVYVVPRAAGEPRPVTRHETPV